MISLHDPAVRGPECDGRWVDLGEHPVPDADSRVAVRGRWLLGAENRAVRGEQVYVERGPDGQTLTQVELPVRFRLWTPAQIEAAAGEHGLVQRACFGDYQGGGVGPSSRVRIIEFARKQS